MIDAGLILNHVQMPARDPEGLARWYAQTFDLRAQGNRVLGPGLLIAFKPGEPVQRAPELHIGFNVPSMAALKQWAEKLGTQVVTGRSEFASVSTCDPEGNGVELYCVASA